MADQTSNKPYKTQIELNDVRIKVVSQKGKCRWGHKVGDEWIVKNNKTPEGICLSAFQVLIPNIRLFMTDGSIPWAISEAHAMACPDPNNIVVFELKRLHK